jgi:hypothetical protein
MNQEDQKGTPRKLTRFDFLRIAGAVGVGAASVRTATSQPPKKTKLDTPTLACGVSTQVSINLNVCAGPTGAPAGFSIQWMPAAEYVDYTSWDTNVNLCKASFSGNANLSRYNLGANDCVTVNIGEFLFDEGASTNCSGLLECETEYVFRTFAHATSSLSRSDFSQTYRCSTLPCDEPQIGNCTLTQGYWKTHGPAGCNPSAGDDKWPLGAFPMLLGTVNYDAGQICSILNTPAAGNGLIALAHQLIAAKLNIASGADGSAVAQAILDADALIGSKVVPPVGSGSLKSSVTSPLTTALMNYNEGATGPGHCG